VIHSSLSLDLSALQQGPALGCSRSSAALDHDLYWGENQCEEGDDGEEYHCEEQIVESRDVQVDWIDHELNFSASQ